MSEFRRFVIGLVNILLVLGVILGTVFGAASGGWLPFYPGAFIGAGGDNAQIVAMVVGGVVGFLVSAVPAVVIFALSEIAENTRHTLLELRRANGSRRPE